MLLGSQALVNDPYYNDVVLHLRGYDATSGQTFKDYSKYNRTITANGNVAHSTTQKKYGNSSIYFDGNGDYLSVPDSNDFTFDGDFTIETWIYQTATPSVSGTFAGHWFYGIASNCSWVAEITPSNNIRFSYGIGSVNSGVVSSTTITNNSWNHIAFSRSGTSFKMFINGIERGAATISGSLNNCPNVFRVGSGDGDISHNAGYFFTGYLDDVRITRRARDIVVPTQPFSNW